MTKMPEYMQATVVLASLCYTKDVAMKVADSWKVSNEVRSALFDILQFRDKMLSVPELKQWVASNKMSSQCAVNYLAFQKRWDEYREFRKWELPDFPINGQDVMNAYNINPGREVGFVLETMRLYWSRGFFKASKEDLLLEFPEIKDLKEYRRGYME